MRTGTWMLLVGFVGVGCAAQSPEWDPQSVASIKNETETLLKDLDSGSFDAMLAKMDKEAIVFDMDDKNAPMRAQGTDQIRKVFDGYSQMMKTQGVKIASTMVKNDCEATTTMGVCMIEYDQTMTANGQTQGPFKFRGTLVARKMGDQWQWTAWHGSFREMPQMPPGSAPPASEPPKQ